MAMAMRDRCGASGLSASSRRSVVVLMTSTSAVFHNSSARASRLLRTVSPIDVNDSPSAPASGPSDARSGPRMFGCSYLPRING